MEFYKTTEINPAPEPKTVKVDSAVLERYASALDVIRNLSEENRELRAYIAALMDEQIAFDKKWREIMQENMG